MSTKLSLATLDALDPAIARPNYARGDLTGGIVHFGVGNFHRAHQAVYLDALFSKGLGRDFAIIGAGVMEGDKRARDVLAAQDFLTTLVAQEADSSKAQITGAMIDYLEPANAGAIIAQLTDPAIKIASLTITEGGYFLDASDKFDPKHPAIAADAAAPDAPKTVFGMIVAGLRARRDAGMVPFTVMSCDNIPHNGHVTKNAVVGLARLMDADLADWIAANVAFPNGMVDRITPATGDRERGIARDEFGVEDGWPVFCEGYIQWVLEDNFTAGRPPLEEVGVQFVSDVSPYELMKIRILNGGHAVIAYPGGLMGIEFVHDAMQNPLIRGFLDKVEREEIIPGVPPVPNTDLNAYYDLIATRFSNPKIADTERRLCHDGSNRQPKFIIPSLADALKRNGKITGLALESALWCRYCAGTDDAGNVIANNDPNWDKLVPVALAAKDRPQAWLEQEAIYGAIGRDPRLIAAFDVALTSIYTLGVEGALKAYIEDRL